MNIFDCKTRFLCLKQEHSDKCDFHSSFFLKLKRCDGKNNTAINHVYRRISASYSDCLIISPLSRNVKVEFLAKWLC